MIKSGLLAAAAHLPRAWRIAWASLILASAALALGFESGSILSWFAALALALVARGALWRLASGQVRPGPGGLQFGETEIRLAAVWMLATLFLGILSLLAFAVLLCGAYAVASTGKGFDPALIATWAPAITGGGRVVLGGLAVLCAVGLALVAARISLAEAASFASGKVRVLSSFAMTRGRALALIVANLTLAAPVIALALWVRGPISALTLGLAIGGVWLPMSVGLMAYAYDVCARQT